MSIAIPLLQYWHDRKPPPGVRRRMAGWADDPDFEVSVFDDVSAADFLREHFGRAELRAFESCAIPAMRADFFRYAWLYVHGGAYVDADVKNRGGAGELFRETGRGCLFLRGAELPPHREEWRPGRIPNGLMYLRNRHDSAMEHALAQAVENVTNRISNDVWEVTGPGILTAVWGEGGPRADEFFEGFTIHPFTVARSVGQFGHMPFKNRDTYWQKYRDDPAHGSIFRTPGLDDSKDDLVLPPGSRLLHVGPPKTGSTAIQGSLEDARSQLADHGVEYVGVDRARRAGWAIGVRGAPGDLWRQPEERWDELVADVRDAGDDRRVCISNEDFGRAEPDQIRRIVDGLGGAEPHVVAVARRFDKLLPSLWQQRVKVGSPLGYEDWLRIVLDRPDEACTGDATASAEDIERANAWYPQDTPALIRRWGDLVGLDRVTLIVSDDRDRSLLPRTFERMLGLPEGLLALQPGQSNQSLPWSDVEFVRAINEALIAREVPRKARRRLVARGLVHELMARPVTEDAPRTPPLPAWAASVVRELGAARIAEIGALGVRVVGDLGALHPDEVETGDPTRPPAIPGAAAARAVDWLIAELRPGASGRA